jgi:hypothetical protein
MSVMGQDAEVQAGVTALKDWQDAYDIIQLVTGEAPVIPDDGEAPTVEQMYKAALDKMGVPVRDGEDPAALKYIFQSAQKAGAGYGANMTRQQAQQAEMAADSAAVASFHSRFPGVTPARRLF